jgi:hypothetical protein
MGQLAEREFARETEVLSENPLQCHFSHHKSLVTSAGIKPEPPRQETDD